MIKKIVFGVIGAVTVQFGYAATADMVITNAKVYTVNDKQPTAEAVAISGNKIIAVGSSADMKAYIAKQTKVINAKGASVLPGFQEAHAHLVFWPFLKQIVPLGKTGMVGSPQEVVAEFKKGIAKHPGGVSSYFGYATLYEKADQTTRYDLDKVSKDIPLFVSDVHFTILNSKALELAGITKDTPQPDGGTIVKDPKTGEPTGVLQEAASLIAFKTFLVPVTGEEQKQTYEKMIAWHNSHGVTRLQSAGIDSLAYGEGADGKYASIDAIGQLKKENRLNMRFTFSEFAPAPVVTDAFVKQLNGYRTTYHNDWIDVSAVKFSNDGIAETHTSYFLEPYSDAPETRGTPIWNDSDYNTATLKIAQNGYSIWTHAIGDAAVHQALNGYEAIRKTGAKNILRTEHADHITPSDIPRYKQLGVIAVMSPSFMDYSPKTYDKLLGSTRNKQAYPWWELYKTGATVAFGSDNPVTSNPPLDMIYLASSPKENKRFTGKPLTLDQAIRSMTLNGAVAAGRESQEGSIKVGNLADLVILNKDIFKAKHSELHTKSVDVKTTIVDGKIVYQNDKI